MLDWMYLRCTLVHGRQQDGEGRRWGIGERKATTMAEKGWGSVAERLGTGGATGPTTYANNVQILPSSVDLTFVFSQLVLTPGEKSTDPPDVSQTLVQRLIMSPQHAKLFLQLLQQNITQWEQQFGEIEVPPPRGLQSPPEEQERNSP
jgi:hypothetical protein